MRSPLVSLILLLVAAWSTAQPGSGTPGAKVLIAFSSYRERPKHPRVHFYEHDGVGQGKIVGAIDTVDLRSDYHPSLSLEGRYCAFASEIENGTGKVLVWDLKEKKLLDPPALNDTPNGQMHPTLSGDGKLVAFTAWGRPGGSPRWDLFLYDLMAKKLLDLPTLNTSTFDERMPAFSADGVWLAFTSNTRGGVGLTDIYLYDCLGSRVVAVPELNSAGSDIEPSVSADGRLVAFVSDRQGGAGGRDVQLYDRVERKLLPLPGLNSVAHEQSPSLSPDGRFIAFVSERVGGMGERDIYLYDRQAQALLPTPGLNAKQEDLDPCVIVVKE